MTDYYKTCLRCGESLPKNRDFFNRNARSHDGWGGWCLDCIQENKQEQKMIDFKQRKNRKEMAIDHLLIDDAIAELKKLGEDIDTFATRTIS